jgi:WD40 repeat protein
VSFSSDGQYLAALSHSWQVAIWNVRKGLLLHILDVPQGELADNAALAFGPDDRFVFVSGTRATLWELSPDKVAVLQKWTLPPGRVDRVAFPTLDRLILWRMEGERELDGRDPWGPWEKNPRVLRARNLLGPNPPGPLATVRDFKRRTFNGMVTPDGQLFVAGGAGGEKGDQVSVAAFETIGGMKRWQVAGRGGTALDPTGKHVAVSVDDTRIVIKAVADGHEVERLTGEGCVLGPSSARRFAFIAQSADSGRVGFRLVDRSDRDILLFMNSSLWDAARFDLTGRWFAWGNRDGTVTLCDIDEVFDRLEREGLGWEKD